MRERRSVMQVAGLAVEVVRKRMRTIRLTVSPPEGSVRVSAPTRATDDEVRGMVLSRLEWIARHRERFLASPRPAPRRLVTGEVHAHLGRVCRLLVLERPGRPKVSLWETDQGPVLELAMPPCSDGGEEAACAARWRALWRWQKAELEALVPSLLEKWQPVLGVRAASWGIRRMKSRWGSCSPRARRITLGLGLAAFPPECLEYVVVHELAHLIERGHNARFYGVLDRALPGWRELRRRLRADSPAGTPAEGGGAGPQTGES